MASLFIIAAPSGCGKTSLVKALIEKIDNLCVCISHTTRNIRPGEVDGENYFFISQQEFDKISKNRGFIESAQVFDNCYGSARQTVEESLEKGYDTILEIDWQGARQVKQNFPTAVGIFILPPSITALKKRLTKRGQDDPATIERRMQGAVDEMRHFNEFDYLVINDNFEIALDSLSNIIYAQRLSTAQQSNTQKNLLKQLV